MLLDKEPSPWMDEELSIMRGAVRKFIDKEFAPVAKKWEKQGFVDREAWLKAGESGLLCASIPEKWGEAEVISNMKWFLLRNLRTATSRGLETACIRE